jgi:hypothetical protein
VIRYINNKGVLTAIQDLPQTLDRCDKAQWRLHGRPVNVFCEINSFLKRKLTVCRTFEMIHVFFLICCVFAMPQTLDRCDKAQWLLNWRPVTVFCEIYSFLKRKRTVWRTFEMIHVFSLICCVFAMPQTLDRCDKAQWLLNWRPVNVFCEIYSFLKRKRTVCRTFEMTRVLKQQSVETLSYKPEGRGFDPRGGHWNSSLNQSFLPHEGL